MGDALDVAELAVAVGVLAEIADSVNEPNETFNLALSQPLAEGTIFRLLGHYDHDQRLIEAGPHIPDPGTGSPNGLPEQHVSISLFITPREGAMAPVAAASDA